MASRWDRDRFDYEQDRSRGYDDDRYQMRGGGRGARDDYDPYEDRDRRPRAYDDDIVRERRYYEDEPRPARREFAPEYERRAPPVMERERERDYYRRESPPRRPNFLRRQSSLDTFDRRPARNIYERREEYPPPARREDIYREDYRAPAYTDIPLPKTKTKALPPPRHYEDRYYEDIKVAEPDYYGDDDFRGMPERVKEREYIRSRDRREERAHSPARSARTSRSARTRTRRGSSPTSTATSRSSSSSGGTTIKSEYPKKGKTRIPGRLVSKRALIDIGYPYTEEGNTIIVLKALGQDNIDELLKLSEEYKKSEMEIAAARSSAGNIAEERREDVFVPPPMTAPPPQTAPPQTVPPPQTVAPGPPPPPPPQPAPMPAPVQAQPQYQTPAPPPAAPVIIEGGPARDYSPSRTSTTTSYDSHYHHHHEHSAPVPVGPLALAERSRSRSRSRGGREIRAEIRALERELAHRPKHDVGPVGSRELVRAERLPDGQLVVYEEQVEKVEHTHKPARIEKDKKGRLSLSMPRR